MGRLVKVVEDPTGTIAIGANSWSNTGDSYQTTYTYDGLDDLTGVTQGGRDRVFTYDSLSRLISASSPETGPSTAEGDAADTNGVSQYEYDPAGHLTKRTDPRTIVTSYAYDVLGRITQKTYPAGTPSVTYCYDGSQSGRCSTAPGGSAKNLKGRLTMVSSGINQTSYSSYDAMGRVLNRSQSFTQFPVDGGSVGFVLDQFQLNVGPLSAETSNCQ